MKQLDKTLKIGSGQMRSLKHRFHRITPKKEEREKAPCFLKSELQGNISAQIYCHSFLNLLSSWERQEILWNSAISLHATNPIKYYDMSFKSCFFRSNSFSFSHSFTSGNAPSFPLSLIFSDFVFLENYGNISCWIRRFF